MLMTCRQLRARKNFCADVIEDDFDYELHELSQISQGFSRLLEVNWCEFVKFVSGSLVLFGVSASRADSSCGEFGGQIFGCGGEPRQDK